MYNILINVWFVLQLSVAMFKLLVEWLEDFYHEGLFCFWVGPTYPSVVIYKPEFAEVSGALYLPKDFDLTYPNDFSSGITRYADVLS